MGTIAKFWMSYIDFVEIMLDLIRTSREGNRCLHLAAVEDLIPWCFDYNRTNYARCLSWYLKNMHQLVTQHPELDKYLCNGGFSTQLSNANPSGKIPMDPTIEETINKDTQMAEGTKEFSLKLAQWESTT